MGITRRSFGFGLAGFGLVACSNITASGAGTTGAAKTGLPADLRPSPNAGYDAWVANFRTRAQSQGISETTLQAGFRNAGYLPGVIKRDRNQTEFKRSLEDYLSIAVSDERVSKGRAAYQRHQSTLRALELIYQITYLYLI